MHVIWTI